MKRLMLAPLSLVFLFVACQPSGVGHSAYYPGAGDDWERRAPEQVGMDPAALQEAIEFAIANENPAPHDLAIALSQSREPFNELIGQPRFEVEPRDWCCDGDISLPNGVTSSAWT